jgi:hypothetical protein
METMPEPKSPTSLEETLFPTILTLAERSIHTFCQILEALCENLLGVIKTTLKILFVLASLYAYHTWSQGPSETPKLFLNLCCCGLLSLRFGEWSLSKGLPLTGIKFPLITLLLLNGLPVAEVSNFIKNF